SELTDAPKEREILHVAGTDLNHIGIFFDQIDVRFIERFAHDLQTELVPDLGEHLEARLTQPGKSVRRSARLECSAADTLRAAALDHIRYRKRLLPVVHC